MLAAFGIWPALPVSGYWAFTRNIRGPGAGPLPPVTSVALMTVAGIAVWSGPMLASAVAGAYRPEVFGLFGWTIVLFAVIKSFKWPRVSLRGHVRLDPWDWVLAAGLVVAAGLYLGFPTDSILSGQDQGVYANHGVYIARHGRLDVPYPVPKDAADIFSPLSRGYWANAFFPGFYRTQPTMTVQFGHLFPVWLAQAFATLGHRALFRLNGIFGLLSLGVFYGVCRSVLSKPYAIVATLFLAFNPSQIWAARITLTEILTQLCIWSGLLTLFRALESDSKQLARWAGLFLGLSAVVRIDSLLLVPLLLLSHLAHRILDWQTPNRSLSVWFAFYQTGLPIFALSVGYYALFSAPYFRALSPYVRQIAFAGAIALFALIAATPGVLRRIGPWLTSKATLLLVGAALFAITAYAYWIRPSLEPFSTFNPRIPTVGGLRDYREDSLLHLAAYLSSPVVWAAVLGWFLTLWVLARHQRDLRLIAGLVAFAGISAFYLRSPSVFPEHFWAVRRWIPVVIPGFIWFGAIGTSWTIWKLAKNWTAAGACALALVFLGAFTFRADAPILILAENKGHFAQIRRLAEKLPGDEVILAHGSTTWMTPLYIAFDRRVILIDLNTDQGRTVLTRWIAKRAGEQKPVYLLSGEQFRLRGLESLKVDEMILSGSSIQPTFKPLPKEIRQHRITIGIHKIIGLSKDLDYRGLTLGPELIFGVRESGWYPRTWQGSRPIRWTNGAAKLIVPLDGRPPPKALKVNLESTGPKGTRLRVLANGTELFDQYVPAGDWHRTFRLPSSVSGERATIELLSDTFVPRKVMEGNNDPATYGVLVQGIRLLESDQPLSGRPLPPDGYHSQLKLKGGSNPLRVAQSHTIPLRVTIRNIGTSPWPSPADLGRYEGSVRLGILWFEQGKTGQELGGQRAELPLTMFSGDEQEVDVTLKPIDYTGKPLSPGAYEVWIGLVQEQVAWFYNKGDAVLKLAVEIRP